MRVAICLALPATLSFAHAADATSYVVTYVSSRLMPMQGNSGIRGVRKMQATWSIGQLPALGHCVFYSQTLTAYADGENTLQTLMTAGYQFQNDTPPTLNVCLTRRGAISQSSSMGITLFNRLGDGQKETYAALKLANMHGASISITTHKHETETSMTADISVRGAFTLAAKADSGTEPPRWMAHLLHGAAIEGAGRTPTEPCRTIPRPQASAPVSPYQSGW